MSHGVVAPCCQTPGATSPYNKSELLYKACVWIIGQELQVFVQPINNQPPRVSVKHVQVFENGYVIIMPINLDATDADTSDESLTFTIQKPPRNGKLKLQGEFFVCFCLFYMQPLIASG